jgi:hypothetical protein
VSGSPRLVILKAGNSYKIRIRLGICPNALQNMLDPVAPRRSRPQKLDNLVERLSSASMKHPAHPVPRRGTSPQRSASSLSGQRLSRWSGRGSAVRESATGRGQAPARALAPELLRLGDDGLPAMHYRPPAGGVTGLLVLAPGSRGGMGPGQTSATLGVFASRVRSIYSLLALRLAAQGVAVVQVLQPLFLTTPHSLQPSYPLSHLT